MGHWQLFLDESGDVTDPTMPFGVVGWAVGGYDSLHLRAQLAQSMRRIWPTPDDAERPHQAHLNEPGTFALVAWRRRSFGLLLNRSEVTLADATDRWPGLGSTVWESSWRPRLESAKALGAWLRAQQPTAYVAASQLLGDAEERVAKELGTLADRCGSPVFAIGGILAGSAAGHEPPEARYRSSFQLVIERLRRLLRGQKGYVWVHASRARVGGFQLDRSHFDRWIQECAAGPGGGDAPTVFLAELTRNDRRDGLVIADLVANRLLRVVRRSAAASWPGFIQGAAERVFLPVETSALATASDAREGQTRMPSVAADGIAADVLRGGQPRERLGEVTPPWVREQAERWLDAGGVGR